MSDLNSYSLMRAWFDFSFSNPMKVRPVHTALYSWLVELNNRMGWAAEFSSPASQSMAACGISNYKTYASAMKELIDFGFVIMVRESTNQYTSCVIAMVKNTKALPEALPLALSYQLPEQSSSTALSTTQGTAHVNKQETNKPLNKKHETTEQIPLSIENGSFDFGKEANQPIQEKSPPSSGGAPPKGKSLYTKFIEAFDIWFKEREGVPAKIDGAQGNAAKNIISHFKRIVRAKAEADKKELTDIETDGNILEAWKYFLDGWDYVEPFYNSKMRLVDINSNLQTLIKQIRDGYGNKPSAKGNNDKAGQAKRVIQAIINDTISQNQ